MPAYCHATAFSAFEQAMPTVDTTGAPTKAAEGFARGQGLDVSKLEAREGYLYAVKRLEGVDGESHAR